MDANAPPRLRRPWRHGPVVESPAPRGAGHRRSSCRHLRRCRGSRRSAGRSACQLHHPRAQPRPRRTCRGAPGCADRLRRRAGRCAHRGRLRRSGHDRGGGGRRPRPPGAANRVASVRDKRAGTAVLLAHRRQGGSAPGGCSMTTSLSPRTLGIDAAPSAPGPIPFSRLVRVEWAKATDTRAARWLLALVALSTAGMMLVPVLAPTSFDQTYASYLGVAAVGLSILLPVVAILMLTGEWSQRSVMTTFTQEPRRIRVLNAKLAVSMVLGGGAAVFGGVVTAAGLGLASASGRALEANLTVGAITGYLLFVLLNVLAGVALGALLRSSAIAIAACFALPAAFALLGTASTLVSDWIDMNTTWNWVLENDWAGHVPQISFSIVFWVAVPLAAGVVRTMRRDVT